MLFSRYPIVLFDEWMGMGMTEVIDPEKPAV